MQTKTKIIISVIISIILLGLAGVFYYKNKQNKSQVKIQSEIIQDAKLEDAAKSLDKPAAFIEGEVINLADNQLEIKDGEFVSKVGIGDEVTVYVFDGHDRIDKKLSDIQPGMKVEVGVEARNSLVMMIRIL